MSKVFVRNAFICFSAVAAASAHANVTFYDLIKLGDFSQTSTAQPVTADGYRWSGRIFTDTPGEATSGTLTDPSENDYSMNAVDPQQIGYFSSEFADLASLDAAVPGGNYQYSIDGGTLSPATAILSLPTTFMPDAVPYFSAASFAKIMAFNPFVSNTLDWNTFTNTSTDPTYFKLNFFTVYDLTAGGVAFSGAGDSSYQSDTIAANTLIAGHTYDFVVDFSSRFEQANAGFGTGTALEGFDYDTGVIATAVPEPVTMLLLAPGIFFLARRRKA